MARSTLPVPVPGLALHHPPLTTRNAHPDRLTPTPYAGRLTGPGILVCVLETNPTVTVCPTTGLHLLPGSGSPHLRWLPTWPDYHDAARELVLHAIAQVTPATPRDDDGVLAVPVTLGLLPRPDNDYSSDAIAVITPSPGQTALDPDRQVAWIKQEHTRSLLPSVLGLAAISDRAAGARCTVHVEPTALGDDEDGTWEAGDDGELADDWSTEGVLTAGDIAATGYRFVWFRADIAPWEDTRDAVLAAVHAHLTDRIAPMQSARTPLTPHGRGLPRGEHTLTLHAGPGGLHASTCTDPTPVAHLHPAGRDFFARTHTRVTALGGTALARAVVHRGSLEVFCEDTRPPTHP